MTTNNINTGFSAAPADPPSNRFQPAQQPIGPDGLTDAHRNRLLRVITADMIAARGYGSVTRRDVPHEYADYQRRNGLLIPRWPVLLDRSDGSQLRPDRPRIHHGKPIKYESPVGQLNAIDAHPFVRPMLVKVEVPLFICEGTIKSDAAVAAGLCCVCLTGVWSWRGARERGGAPLALADWEGIALRGRIVILSFDADVLSKRSVYDALVRLKAFLERKGADVRVLYLESGDLEDYFADGYARVA